MALVPHESPRGHEGGGAKVVRVVRLPELLVDGVEVEGGGVPLEGHAGHEAQARLTS